MCLPYEAYEPVLQQQPCLIEPFSQLFVQRPHIHEVHIDTHLASVIWRQAVAHVTGLRSSIQSFWLCVIARPTRDSGLEAALVGTVPLVY